MRLYPSIHASLLRFCDDFARAQIEDVAVINFDAHSDDSTFPESDIVGISGLAIHIDEKLVDINFLIGYSTLNDTNLFRMVDKMGSLLQLLLPESRLVTYDESTGLEIGKMVVQTGVMVLPISRGNVRPIQFVSGKMSSTITLA